MVLYFCPVDRHYAERRIRGEHRQANSRVDFFKVLEGGGAAVRVTVRLGRNSVDTIEIVGGLAEGDEVILSDMSAFSEFDRVRLR